MVLHAGGVTKALKSLRWQRHCRGSDNGSFMQSWTRDRHLYSRRGGAAKAFGITGGGRADAAEVAERLTELLEELRGETIPRALAQWRQMAALLIGEGGASDSEPDEEQVRTMSYGLKDEIHRDR